MPNSTATATISAVTFFGNICAALLSGGYRWIVPCAGRGGDKTVAIPLRGHLAMWVIDSVGVRD
ncbi:hypothetical protein GCM10007937_45090 [Mesorhizobium albiziae]|nr:hypothetical protein GCM10007937_45090 [Mesorhizobium albiziae]